MSILKNILEFLGGKPPQVIFRNGEITHEHTEKKWKDWRDRFEKNPEYQWKQHKGFKGKDKKS